MKSTKSTRNDGEHEEQGELDQHDDPQGHEELHHYLFGDIFSVTVWDVGLIYLVALFGLVGLFFLWRPLLLETLDESLAQSEGIPRRLVSTAFMVLLALVVLIAMQVTGVLLTASLIVIPAAAAQRFASSSIATALSAAIIGVLSVVTGLGVTTAFHTPPAASIVTAATLFYILALALGKIRARAV